MAETLTEDQRNAVSKLKSLLKEDTLPSIYEDTQYLIRFLIARDYNVEKAESMIRKNIRWQKEMQLENIITDFKTPEVLTKYYPISFLGYDKEGVPIEYLEYENLDEKGLFKCINISQLRKLYIKTFERDIKSFKQGGTGNSPKQLYIHNVHRLSLSRFLNKNCYRPCMKISMEFQDNYPENVKNVIIINASPTFALIWSTIKEWLGSSLLKKILVYGEEGWKEELLKRIDADVLPAFLGGNRTDPDGNSLCLTTVNHGGLVPKEYFIEMDTHKFLQNPGAIAAKIGRQQQLTVPVQIAESNCIIKWEFIVQNYDIGFGLSLLMKDEIFEELIPVHKIETERLPECGMYRCKNPGSYSVIFDNSYSWIHAKDIFYRIWVTPAD